MRQITPAGRAPRCARRPLVPLCVVLFLFGNWLSGRVHASSGGEYDPFEPRTAVRDPFERRLAARDPFEEPHRPLQAKRAKQVATANTTADVERDKPSITPVFDPFDSGDEAARIARRVGRRVQLANFQVPAADDEPALAPQADAGRPPAQRPSATLEDPCAVAEAEKKLFELGIDISLPEGRLPTDFAAACWDTVHQPGNALVGWRSWPASTYLWDATCFYHRPLYFEEINLERYGYGCAGCLQPAASAAHFFGTVPALPYLIAAATRHPANILGAGCPPHECVYTLGHYRPGSCPPWRHHWPPCDPLAAAAQGGVVTGLIFLIP